jgi:nucleotide sugar dehydrogenase
MTTVSMPGTMGGAKLVFTNYEQEKIGIVGLGYVGGAVQHSMDHGLIKLVLLDPAKQLHASYEELAECSGIFVCVPSPQGDDGSCDTSILEYVLMHLDKVNYKGVIISKCTAPPNVYEELNAKYPNLVHVPEFLTAAKADQDYVNGKFAFIGGNTPAYMREAERIIKYGQGALENIHYCTIAEAALAKYVLNSFMATKVVFMNELYQLSQALGINYEKVASMIKVDPRVGKTHLQVPGPDGAFGFGGACFPKDTAALLKFAEDCNVQLNVLDAAVKKNTILRLTEPK